MQKNPKIGNYQIGQRVEFGAFGIDTVLLKHQIGNQIQYFEGRTVRVNATKKHLKPRQMLFNEMQILKELGDETDSELF